MFLRGAIGHFKTITAHRHEVIKNCFKAGIFFQGLGHDLSKYSWTEFSSGAKYYEDGKRSPNEREREVYGYSKAWLHHKGRNKHHFEYWTDYDTVTKVLSPIKMPTKYVIEMFCDRVAASKTYQGDKYTDSHPINYFLRSKKTRIIHPKTSDYIEFLLRMLEEKGEKATFEYIRAHKNDEY